VMQGIVVTGENLGSLRKEDDSSIGFNKAENDPLHGDPYKFRVFGGQHQHEVWGPIGSLTVRPSALAMPPSAEADLHTHSVDQANAGVTDPSLPLPAKQLYTARSGDPLTYVDDLRVSIGTKVDNLDDCTTRIQAQIGAARPSEDWSKLGEGPTAANHPFIVNGTGAIRLDLLPQMKVDFSEGEYLIELSAPQLKDAATGKPLLDSNGNPVPNGGRILYNLYIE